MTAEPVMAESRINAKGQTAVPAQIRRRVRAGPGTKLVLTTLSDGTIIVRPTTRKLVDLAGILSRPDGRKVDMQDQSR